MSGPALREEATRLGRARFDVGEMGYVLPFFRASVTVIGRETLLTAGGLVLDTQQYRFGGAARLRRRSVSGCLLITGGCQGPRGMLIMCRRSPLLKFDGSKAPPHGYKLSIPFSTETGRKVKRFSIPTDKNRMRR